MKAIPDEMTQAYQWTAAKFGTARETRPPRADGEPAQSAFTPEPAFSFVYEGQASSHLLRDWQVERDSRTLDSQRTEQTLIYTDARSGLRVRCVATVYGDYPAVEWVLYFKNGGASDTSIIENIQALDTCLPCRNGKAVLHYAKGSLCSLDDFAPVTRVLNPGARVQLQPGGGRSSSENLPFFNVETTGEGVILAIGWTGEWAATFSRDDGEDVLLQAGMAHTHFKLRPGEEVRSPRVLLLFWQRDRVRGQNLLRQFILSHHRPSVGGEPLVVPACVGNWGGTPASVHLDNAQQIVVQDLPLDYYWIDAEWFGGDPPWWKQCGNWEARQDLYPQGFRPISDMLHQTGRKFLLWFEPERVCKGTPWYREHEDWLLKLKPGDECLSWPYFADQADPGWVFLESQRNQIAEGDALLDLGNPEARRFLTDFISDKITQFGIDCYRHDANIAPLKFWQNADAPDRQGITEIRWVEGLYAFWDELLHRHPNLMIDNCASGGRRIDLEAISRSTPLWRTDHPQDPTGKQCHTYGLLSWVPLHSTGALNIAEDDDYTFHSTMSSGMVFRLESSGDVVQKESIPEGFPFNVVRDRLGQYLGVRKFFYGDYYPLTQYTQANDAWMAYQLDRPDLGQGLVVVLKRPLSPFTDAVFPLCALEREALYRVTVLGADGERTVSGGELADEGLHVQLAKKPDSVLIFYRRE